jgi:hypothetical protein
LIVTGVGEREFIPAMFRSLTAMAGCSFLVLRKIGQRSTIGPAKIQRMVGRGQTIPARDEEEIGLEARKYLYNQPCHFVIMLDDVEDARRYQIPGIFGRYRKALDTMLLPEDRVRASVHFFANMLEAYYFADISAVNDALGVPVLQEERTDDVETIRHPKNELKVLSKACGVTFDEKTDGAKIIAKLRLDHVLSNSGTCAFLRSLFAWCVRQLQANCPIWDDALTSCYQIPDGIMAELTNGQ